MKNKNTVILLIIMHLLRLFSGISINRKWGFVFQFEFFDFLQLRAIGLKHYLSWGIIILSHIGILALPFLRGKRYFAKALLLFPLIYFLYYLIFWSPFFLLLIPELVIWAVVLVRVRRYKKQISTAV